MSIGKAIRTMIAGTVLLACMGAHALAPINATTYSFTCSNPALSLTPVSFNLPAAAAAATGSAQKVVYGPLTIVIVANKSYQQLFEMLTTGEAIHSCTLVQTVVVGGTGGSTTVYKWTFSLLALKGVTAIGTDASSPNYAGQYVPTALVEATFAFSGVQVSID